ncbi:hypothetical protein LTR70_010003 [Exophiala xenobiotica]|uniref:ubiquitinyl hydrolase 1 n=1 Tax=Lithohypha guttulata TaxID=1690604 RepID=A0ABR0JVR2_9EURO|nr:hypothetical protein LTR24_009869 [Lithohypha guttulata]KAK5309780.1 hypothetical protein LTR70_010003 [Exophiala xenobiotica]
MALPADDLLFLNEQVDIPPRSIRSWVIEPTPDIQLSNAKHIESFARTVEAFERFHEAPNIADVTLRDLLKLPERRLVRVRIAQRDTDRYKIEVAYDNLDGARDPERSENNFQAALTVIGYTAAQVEILARRGLIPILERLLLPANEVSQGRWLLKAAERLAAADEAFTLRKNAPTVLVGAQAGTVVQVTIRGIELDEQDRYQEWRLERQISLGSVNEPFPYQHDFDFEKRTTWLDAQPRADTMKIGLPRHRHIVDLTNVEQSKDFLFAQWLVIAFDGYIGKRADAKQQVDIAVLRACFRNNTVPETAEIVTPARYESAVARPSQPFVLPPQDDHTMIDECLPWRFRYKNGTFHIRPKRHLKGQGQKNVVHIQPDLLVVVEVLNAILIKWITGRKADTCTLFGKNTAKALEDPDVVATGSFNPCKEQDRKSHWHVCAGCLSAYPCHHFPTRDSFLMCCERCSIAGKPVGWKLLKVMQDAIPEVHKVHVPKVHVQKVQARFNFYLNEEGRRIGRDLHAEKKAVWQTMQQLFQLPGELARYRDIYVKDQVLDSDPSTRTEIWTGQRKSPLAPTVEGVHRVFILDDNRRYHAPGNLAITSSSMNSIAGENPKIALKAVRQFLHPESEEDELDAVRCLLLCASIRAEFDLNNRLPGIGQQATPYLQRLAEAVASGNPPIERYVPNEVVLAPFSMIQIQTVFDPDWRPDNFADKVQPHLEKIAQKFNLDSPQMRPNWTIIGDMTGGVEVPFPFSKHSIKLATIRQWTWYDFFMWCCYKLARLRTTCDNHLVGEYRGDAEAARSITVQQFMFSVMNIYMLMLVKDRDEGGPQYPSQGLRARDAAGLEPLVHLRNPMSMSIAHEVHGAAMLVGYPDQDGGFTTDQGQDAFDEAQCNIALETLALNVGKWSHDNDQVASIMGQFANLRVKESEFVPGAPRPYPAGETLASNSVRFNEYLFDQPLSAEDEDFAFSKSAREKLRRYLPQSGVPTLSFEQQGSDISSLHSSVVSTSESESDSEDEPVYKTAVPKRANLGRGHATCYVSSPLQMLHNITPFKEAIQLSEVQEIRDKHVLKDDPELKRHHHFHKSLQATMGALSEAAGTSRKLSAGITQGFRRASELGAPDIWEDKEEDANEYIQFLLKVLNLLTDRSEIEDRTQSDWTKVDGVRILVNPADRISAPLQRDCDEVYEKKKHATPVTRSCACIAFEEVLEVQVLGNENVNLASLRDAFLVENEASDDPGARHCLKCTTGKLTTTRRSIRNAPELLMLAVRRGDYRKEISYLRTFMGRIEDADMIRLAAWQTRLPSEPASAKRPSAEYELIGTIMYRDVVPHYIAFVREGLGNEGPWVCYDDLKTAPTYGAPNQEEFRAFTETLLVYRKRTAGEEHEQAGHPATTASTASNVPEHLYGDPDVQMLSDDGDTVPPPPNVSDDNPPDSGLMLGEDQQQAESQASGDTSRAGHVTASGQEKERQTGSVAQQEALARTDNEVSRLTGLVENLLNELTEHRKEAQIQREENDKQRKENDKQRKENEAQRNENQARREENASQRRENQAQRAENEMQRKANEITRRDLQGRVAEVERREKDLQEAEQKLQRQESTTQKPAVSSTSQAAVGASASGPASSSTSRPVTPSANQTLGAIPQQPGAATTTGPATPQAHTPGSIPSINIAGESPGPAEKDNTQQSSLGKRTRNLFTPSASKGTTPTEPKRSRPSEATVASRSSSIQSEGLLQAGQNLASVTGITDPPAAATSSRLSGMFPSRSDSVRSTATASTSAASTRLGGSLLGSGKKLIKRSAVRATDPCRKRKAPSILGTSSPFSGAIVSVEGERVAEAGRREYLVRRVGIPDAWEAADVVEREAADKVEDFRRRHGGT